MWDMSPRQIPTSYNLRTFELRDRPKLDQLKVYRNGDTDPWFQGRRFFYAGPPLLEMLFVEGIAAPPPLHSMLCTRIQNETNPNLSNVTTLK